MSSSRFLVAAFAAALALAVGCQHDDNDMHHDNTKGSTTNAAMMDACPHCAGVQTATAEGKCPVCGADVKAPMKSPAGGATSESSPQATGTAASTVVDACAHCPGVQTANADGKCPVCGAQVVQKQ